MQFSFSRIFIALVALATFGVTALPTNGNEVILDIHDMDHSLGLLRMHADELGSKDFSMLNLIMDNRNVINGLHKTQKDAESGGAFTESEAMEIVRLTAMVAKQVAGVSNTFITKQGLIPSSLHPAVVADLQKIADAAHATGKAILADCPPAQKGATITLYADMAHSLTLAMNAFGG